MGESAVRRALELQEQCWRLQAAGKLDLALEAGREALLCVEASEGVDSADAANLLNDLAEIECDRQELDAALELMVRARTIETAWSWSDVDLARVAIRTRTIAGEVLRALGRYDMAELDLSAALDIAVRAFGQDAEETANARNNLAVLFKYSGRHEEGLALYRRALESIATRHGEHSLEAGVLFHNIGGILHAAGRFDDAMVPARRAWEISRHLLGDDDVQTLRDAAAYAAVLDGLEQYDESETIHTRVLTGFERLLGDTHEDVASACHNLSEVRAARGDTAGAEAGFRRALAIRDRRCGPESHDAALTRNALGRLLSDMGRHDEARALLDVAVAVLTRQLSAGHPHLIAARGNLARLR